MKYLAIMTFSTLLPAGSVGALGDGLAFPHELEVAARCRRHLVELRAVKIGFRAVEVPAQPTGWATAHQAALAFYAFQDAAYQDTDETTELVGFLLRSAEGRYFFTDAARVPYAFRLTARIDRPHDWTIGSLLHTHPGGRECQEEFSIEDRETVLKGATRGNYVRTPLGNVLFLNRHLAETTSTRRGAFGMSICPDDQPCLAAHPRELARVQYVSR